MTWFERLRARFQRSTSTEIIAVGQQTHVWVLDVLGDAENPGTPVYTDHTVATEAGGTIARYLELLEIDPAIIGSVTLRGERIKPDEMIDVEYEEALPVRLLRKLMGLQAPTYRARRIDHELVGGHVLFVIPLLQGKNAGLILGIVGAVIGAILVPGSLAWTMPTLQAAMVGFSIGSYLGTLLTPKPSTGKGDKSMTSFGWQGIQNEYRAGTPVPIAFGKHKSAPVRVGMFIRRDGAFTVTPTGVIGGESLYLLFLVSIGRIQSISDVKINGQPYASFGGGIQIATRLGTVGQAILPGFKANVSTISDSTLLTTSPYIYTTTTAVDAFEVLFTIPGLFHFDAQANLTWNQTHWRTEYRKVGDSTWIIPPFGERRLNGTSRTIERDTQRVQDLVLAHYQIRMTWIGAEHTDATKDGWQVYVTGVNEETQHAPTYDYGDHQYAMLGIHAIATDKLSGGVPLVTCVTEGLLTQQYDGTALTAPTYSRSPAWAALFLFLNTTVGAGNWLDGETDLDLQSFKDWADYCLEDVTVTPATGIPYTEPRHLFDVVINQQRPFLDTLLDLCATARATPVMVGEKWKMVIDRASPVRQTFAGPGNIIEKSLSIAYRSDAQRVNTYDVSIMEEANDWNVEPFRLKSKHLVIDLGDPVRPEPLTLWGITRKSQGFRETTFRLSGLAYLRRIVQFLAYTDAILIEAGDVIAVAHDIPQWGYPGRATGGSTTTIILDRAVTIELGHTYEVLVRFQDGSNGGGDVRTVTTPPGVTNILTFTPAVAQAVAREDLYAFGPLALSTKPYRVVAITRSSSGIRRIVALEYYVTLFDDTGIVDIPVYTQLPNLYAPPPALSNLALTELVEQRTDLSRPSTLLIQWDRPLPVAGKGVFEGARLDLSWDSGVSYQTLGGYHLGTEFRWQNAPQNVLITIRATPRSTKGIFNDAGAIVASITLVGWTTPPADVTALPAVAKDGRFLYSWVNATRAILYEARMADTGWGTDSNFVYRDHATAFAIEKPLARTVTLYVRALDQFGNVSANTTPMVCTDAAPAAPTPLTASIVTTSEIIKIPVTPPADIDVIAIHLHASTTTGFTPLGSNRVASVVSAKGGDFVFRPPAGTPGPWYFRVTSQDPLSERLDDWIYSSQFSASLFVIAPVNPGTPTFSENPTPQHRRAVVNPGSGVPPAMTKIFSLFLNWTFTDSVNPAATHIGFYVEVYPSSGTAAGPILSETLTNTAQRSWGISDLTLEASGTYIGAVKALYIDGYSSSLITSTGLALDPAATGEDVLAQLKTDVNGGYYLNNSVKLTDGSGMIVTIEKNGITTTTADGTVQSPKRAIHSLLRDATDGQWVPWDDTHLDPKFTPAFGFLTTSKLHVVSQMRHGANVGFSPLHYPVRTICDATEISDSGFRLQLQVVEGCDPVVLRDTAPIPGGWTPSAIHGSLMTFDAAPVPTATLGHAAWYDPLSVQLASGATWSLSDRDILWLAADMPTVLKPDGTPWFVDLYFQWNRVIDHITWTGVYGQFPAGSYSQFGNCVLRAYTNGKRWRVPLTLKKAGFQTESYLTWWVAKVFEAGANTTACLPTRVLMDAFESHGFIGTPFSFRGALTEDVDILLVEDF